MQAEGPSLPAPHQQPRRILGILFPSPRPHQVIWSPSLPAPEAQFPPGPPGGSTSAQTTSPPCTVGVPPAPTGLSGSESRGPEQDIRGTWFLRRLLPLHLEASNKAARHCPARPSPTPSHPRDQPVPSSPRCQPHTSVCSLNPRSLQKRASTPSLGRAMLAKHGFLQNQRQLGV